MYIVLLSIFLRVANFYFKLGVNESWIFHSQLYTSDNWRTFWRLAFGFTHFTPYFSFTTYIYFSCWDMFISQFCPWPWTFMLWCQMSCHGRERSIPESHSYSRRPKNNLTKHENDCKPQKFMPFSPNFMYPQLNFSLARYQKCLLPLITVQ